jgi:hypothetical protein
VFLGIWSKKLAMSAPQALVQILQIRLQVLPVALLGHPVDAGGRVGSQARVRALQGPPSSDPPSAAARRGAAEAPALGAQARRPGSVTATCRQQGRTGLDYLVAAETTLPSSAVCRR